MDGLVKAKFVLLLLLLLVLLAPKGPSAGALFVLVFPNGAGCAKGLVFTANDGGGGAILADIPNDKACAGACWATPKGLETALLVVELPNCCVVVVAEGGVPKGPMPPVPPAAL